MPGKLLRPPFQSAFDGLDCQNITAADVVAFHRSVFGDLRMENDPDPTDPPAPTPPAPTPTPQAPTDPTDPPAPTGFPADTPLTEMTVEQREAYWKHQARKHETRSNARADYDEIKAERDRLKQATETDTEKAVREAREAGKAEARSEVVNETVKSLLRMGLRARGVKDEDLDEVVSTINLSAHADDNGVVDDEKVLRTVNRLAGTAGNAGPDTGQGNRGGQTRKSGVSAGAELFAASRGKKTTTS